MICIYNLYIPYILPSVCLNNEIKKAVEGSQNQGNASKYRESAEIQCISNAYFAVIFFAMNSRLSK